MKYGPVDLSKTILRTMRLILRPWQVTDVDDLFAYAHVDGVGQMAGWDPHKTKETSLAILQTFIAEKKTLAVEYDGRVIGAIDAKTYEPSNDDELKNVRCVEIGYVLSKDYWGRGLMPEALAVFITYLFEKEDMEVLLCGYYDENKQSARVQEKCGFTFYKREETMSARGTNELINYTILYRTDWMKEKRVK